MTETDIFPRVTDTVETLPDGRRARVIRVGTELGTGTAVLPVLDAAGEARRDERIRSAFAGLLRDCARERGIAWLKERGIG